MSVMKKLTPYLIIPVLFGIIGLLCGRISVHKKNLDRIKENMEVLLESNNDLILKVHRYQIQDSLNVAQIRSLELTAKEFKACLKEDAKLIESLKIRNKDLEAFVNTKLETRDTILVAVHDTIPGVATFNYTSTLTDLSGTSDIMKDTM